MIFVDAGLVGKNKQLINVLFINVIKQCNVIVIEFLNKLFKWPGVGAETAFYFYLSDYRRCTCKLIIRFLCAVAAFEFSSLLSCLCLYALNANYCREIVCPVVIKVS